MKVLRGLLDWIRGVPSGPDPAADAHTPRPEAERIAAEWANRNRKLWSTPVLATFKVERGRAIWVVESNYAGRGHRIFVTVDDASGTVVGHDEVLTR